MKKFIFTFMIGQDLGGYCQPIYAKDAEKARDKMIELYGRDWGFQYTGQEWEKHKRNPERRWSMEKELEPIYSEEE